MPPALNPQQSSLPDISSFSATDPQGISLLPPPHFSASFDPPPPQCSPAPLALNTSRGQKEALTVSMCILSPQEKYPYAAAAAQTEISKQKLVLHQSLIKV